MLNKKIYVIYECGYTHVAEFEDKEEANNFCKNVNTKTIKKKVKGKIVIKEKKVIRFHVKEIEKQVKGTLAVEGIKPSIEGEKITNKFLNGYIESDTAINQIKEYHLNKGGVIND